MQELEIVPYKGFGPVRFGATEDEVVDAVGQQPHHARAPELDWTCTTCGSSTPRCTAASSPSSELT